jgi:hypothetical protein
VETQTSPEGHNQPGPSVFRKDVIDKATEAIAEYSNVIEGAYANANPVLNRALACTYAAAIVLLKDPQWLADFVGGKRSGPKSANRYVPIVRELWRGVPTRDTVRRHACCLAMADDQKIKPDEFATWLTAYKGGIKQISNDWSKRQRKPEASVPRAQDQKAQVDSLLSRFAPVPLPAEMAAGYQAGRYLAVIDVTSEGQASVTQVFTDMAPAKVDAFIVRELQR